MKKIKIVLGILACIFFTISGNAQQDPKIETERLLKLSQKLEGTYQVQIINMRQEIAFPLSELDKIEAKRQKTDTTYYWMENNIRVVILPKRIIELSNFKKLSPAIIHTN